MASTNWRKMSFQKLQSIEEIVIFINSKFSITFFMRHLKENWKEGQECFLIYHESTLIQKGCPKEGRKSEIVY